jgi:hypothetical protein
MPKKHEDPKLTPISENELGQIEGGFAEMQGLPPDELTSTNIGCPPPIGCDIGCLPPTPTPTPAS